MQQEFLEFESRAVFRSWLAQCSAAQGGVWVRFDKNKGAHLTASQALEEALCFGWIDGQMERLDTRYYLKYFAPRRPQSKWSEKNKALVASLRQAGQMTAKGEAAVEAAKQNGMWDCPKPQPISEEQIAALAALLPKDQPAYSNFSNMPPSAQRGYTGLYFDAKTEAGRLRRLERITERLNQNKKPME